jgi:hypothetical protein
MNIFVIVNNIKVSSRFQDVYRFSLTFCCTVARLRYRLIAPKAHYIQYCVGFKMSPNGHRFLISPYFPL